MKKLFPLILIGAVSLLPFQNAFSQSLGYAGDALLFSRTSPVTGSARIRGMGGAQIALGGDISAAYGNPAGLGFYNNSEISISPTFFLSSNDATYQNSARYDYSNNLSFSNFSLVIAGGKNNNTEGWLGGNFAVSYQRINNFNNQFSYEGENAQNGLVDVFIGNYLEGSSDIFTELAYATYLVGDYSAVDQDGNPYDFYSFVYPASEDAPYLQQETVDRSGGQNQLDVSFGGNISDKYYFGAGLGITSIDYRQEKTFSESYFPDDEVTGFNLYEEQILRGSGINASLGFIARPVPNLSVGITYQTPTIYSMEEAYYTQLTTNYNDLLISDFIPDHQGEEIYLDGSVSDDFIVDPVFAFNLRTPGKLGLGGAYFFQKAGFISADVEFINYRNNRLTDDRNELRADNETIQRDFTSAVNFRLGGEYRFDIFRLRAGYALQGDPYQNQDGWDRHTNTFTGGAGLKFRNFYTDLALNYEMGEQYYSPYMVANDSPLVSIDNLRTTAILTFGLTF
jgi:hypothetical protein